MKLLCLLVFLLFCSYPTTCFRSSSLLSSPTLPRFASSTSSDQQPSDLPEERTTRFAWDRPPPKRSLELVGTSETAAPWILSLVEYSHWSFVVPTVYGAHEILQNYDAWLHPSSFFDTGVLEQMDTLRMLCLISYQPVFFAAALFPSISHIYDDWQIAPFRDGVDRSYGNDRLRRICVNLLFQGIGVASTMCYHAVLGWEGLYFTLGLATYAFLGDKNHLISKYLPMNQDSENIVAPVPVGTFVFFVYSQIAYCWALWSLVRPFWSSDMMLPIATVSTVGMLSAGGIYEGFITESSFNQWDHLRAAVFFMIGFSSQAFMYHEFGQVFGAI